MTDRCHVDPYDSTRLIVLLSLFAGFCLGTALTIAAYSLRLLS